MLKKCFTGLKYEIKCDTLWTVNIDNAISLNECICMHDSLIYQHTLDVLSVSDWLKERKHTKIIRMSGASTFVTKQEANLEWKTKILA